MLNFNNFYKTHLEIVFKALDFAKELISEYYGIIAASVDQRNQQPIWDEMNEIIKPINVTIEFFKKNSYRTFMSMYESDFSFFMDAIRSSLEVYRKDLEETKTRTGIKGYDILIKQVDDVSNLSGPTKGRKDLFIKYYSEKLSSSLRHSKNGIKIFISYQEKDVDIACKIKQLLVDKSNKIKKEAVFVAHRDIPLTEEWRKEIILQLENCTHLMAICTENFKCSAFGNQELGYAMAMKDVDVIPIFWEGTDRSRFGFMEGFQTLPKYVNDTNLEEIIMELLERLFEK